MGTGTVKQGIVLDPKAHNSICTDLKNEKTSKDLEQRRGFPTRGTKVWFFHFLTWRLLDTRTGRHLETHQRENPSLLLINQFSNSPPRFIQLCTENASLGHSQVQGSLNILLFSAFHRNKQARFLRRWCS